MYAKTVFRIALAASLLAVAACDTVSEASRSTAGFDASGPRARTGETIILGKDDVIRVSELTPAQYRQQLTRLTLQFERQTPNTVYFDQNDVELDAEARARLDAQAKWIIGNPQVRVSVTGHADDVINPASNRELGMQRARAVVAYLVRRGIDRERLIALVSKGQDKPLGDTEDQARLNRRVETTVIEIFELRNNEDGSVLEAATPNLNSSPSGTPAGGSPSSSAGGGSTGGGSSGGGTGGSAGDTKDKI